MLIGPHPAASEPSSCLPTHWVALSLLSQGFRADLCLKVKKMWEGRDPSAQAPALFTSERSGQVVWISKS